jgi:hypothetical protein
VGNGVDRTSAEVLVAMQLASAEAVGRLVARHPERRTELEEEYIRFALAASRAARRRVATAAQPTVAPNEA